MNTLLPTSFKNTVNESFKLFDLSPALNESVTVEITITIAEGDYKDYELIVIVNKGEFDPFYVDMTFFDAEDDSVVFSKDLPCDDMCNLQDQINELFIENMKDLDFNSFKCKAPTLFVSQPNV